MFQRPFCPAQSPNLARSDPSGKCQLAPDPLPTVNPGHKQARPRSAHSKSQAKARSLTLSQQALYYASSRTFHLPLGPPDPGLIQKINNLLFLNLYLFIFKLVITTPMFRAWKRAISWPSATSHGF